jgi:hypothetical protein
MKIHFDTDASFQALFERARWYILNGILAAFSFFAALLLSPLVSLKYRNPHGILGPLAQLQFNPANNLLRFLFILLVASGLFYFLHSCLRAKRWTLLRVIVIAFFTASYFFSSTTIYIQKTQNIDMFHDGEQLGVGAAIYDFGLRPYQDMFFLHGAFGDPLIADYAFKLLGRSIGSYFLLDWLLTVLSIGAFFSLLSLLIRNHILFFGSAFFFYGMLDSNAFALGRELAVLPYLLMMVLIVRGILRERLGFLLTSFLAFFSLYLSVDRGLYLFLGNLVFIGAYIAFKHLPWERSIAFWWRVLKQEWQIYLSGLVGILLAVLAGAVWFGLDAMPRFFRMTFVEIPQFNSLMFDYKYPPFSLATLYPHWWPIILIFLSILIVLSYLFYQRARLTRSFVVPIVLVFLSVVFYKSALGRSDIGHVLYIMHIVFLAVVVLIDYMIRHPLYRDVGVLAVGTFIVLFFLPFFSWERVLTLPVYEARDVKSHLRLNKFADSIFVPPSKLETADYIKQHTSPHDYVFDFTNQAAYYYLLQRPNPTRFYMVWFASPDYYQKEALADLQRHPPKFIIYQTDNGSATIDGITNAERVKDINAWIQDHYQHDQEFGKEVIYKQKAP